MLAFEHKDQQICIGLLLMTSCFSFPKCLYPPAASEVELLSDEGDERALQQQQQIMKKKNHKMIALLMIKNNSFFTFMGVQAS